jgi:hypothetical protein
MRGIAYAADGVRLLWRRRSSSAQFGCKALLALLAVNTVLIVSAHVRESVRRLVSDTQITAPLRQQPDGAPAASPAAVAAAVRALPHVAGVVVLSQQQTHALIQARDPALADAVGASQFPVELEVRADSAARVAKVAAAVGRERGVLQAGTIYAGALTGQIGTLAHWVSAHQALLTGLLVALSALALIPAAISAVAAERSTLRTIRMLGADLAALTIPIVVALTLVAALAATLACLAGWLLDPAFARGSGLPGWLASGRSYSLLELWPATAGAAVGATAVLSIAATAFAARRLEPPALPG